MSGIEFIVSAVLAVVPIALEAYDHSGRVFEVFSVSVHYPREVLVLEMKLAAQRTIFRNNAINLLTAVTKDRVRVQEVMNQPSSQSARTGLIMAPVYQHRLDALDESFEACRQVAEHVHNSLQLLCRQSEAFRAEVGEKDKMSTSEWMKHIRARFKLGLNKPRIKGAIEELRDINRDFSVITEQIIKALQETLGEYKDDAALTRRSARSLNILQRYHRARYASNALYSTLQVRWSCPSHRSHLFDVRIRDRNTEKGKSPLTEFVTWELAITHDNSGFLSGGPLRLEIERACESDDEDAGAEEAVQEKQGLQQLTTVLEANAERFELVSPSSQAAKARKLFRGFRKGDQRQTPDVPASTQPNHTRSSAEVNVGTLTTSTKSRTSSDLSLIDDFCKRFQKISIDCINRSLLGSWKGPHAQWFCTPSAPQTTIGTSQSISEIIHWVAEEPFLRSLSRPLLVELAGSMAEGIMQFYSTPWLVPTNLGRTLRYFNSGQSTGAATKLEGPYFMTQLACHQVKGEIVMRSTSAGRSFANEFVSQSRNANSRLRRSPKQVAVQLWNYTARNWVPVAGENAKSLSDNQAAEKLAQLLVNQMGPTYSKIVRKCLGCDFGLGETNLDNEVLQRQFVVDVVSGLQRLGNHMKEMDFAPSVGYLT